MDNYKLAVIIPCWQCAGEIGEMLDSILAQTYHDWHVFCVDDQSIDETPVILKKYSERDPRIHYVIRNREPKGAQTCRNIGFELSEGAEYVIWFDSDDVVAPYCFEQRVTYMNEHPDLDYAVFPAKSFTHDIWEAQDSHLFGYEYQKAEDLRRFLRRTLPFVVWNNIYRRKSVVAAHLLWDESILSLQDTDFNVQAITKDLKYEYAANGRIDYFWRIQGSGITKKIFTDGHKKSHLYFITKLYECLSKQQKVDYALELDDYLFFFIDRFFSDRKFVYHIIKVSYVKYRPFFQLRIILYCLFRKRFKKYLFPQLYSYRIQYDIEYAQYNKKLLSSKLEKGN